MGFVVDNIQKFQDFRAKYPVFTYDSYSWSYDGSTLSLFFNYSFSEKDVIKSSIEINLPEKIGEEKIRENEDYIFRIGLLNALSYWKAYCPPSVVVKCGKIKKKEISWWQDLWYEGMGEFRYLNGLLDIPKESWTQFYFVGDFYEREHDFSKLAGNLIAFTGGKDSSLALGLLKDEIAESETFSINPPENIEKIRKFFGFSYRPSIIISRKMGYFILSANENGALNGHTPFSAIVAMIGVFVANLRNKKYIIVSNEGSANEETVVGTGINHQYSKSLIFEKKFREYCNMIWPNGPEYFSLIRPFSEVNIFEMLKPYQEILPEISSCNKKDKDGAWCGKCGKCLFAFLMFSAVWNLDFAKKITGKDMFVDMENLFLLKELTGILPSKPFECVGTKEESLSAISVIVQKDEKYKEEPVLVEFLKENENILPETENFEKITKINHENFVPEKFLKMILENKNG